MLLPLTDKLKLVLTACVSDGYGGLFLFSLHDILPNFGPVAAPLDDWFLSDTR